MIYFKYRMMMVFTARHYQGVLTLFKKNIIVIHMIIYTSEARPFHCTDAFVLDLPLSQAGKTDISHDLTSDTYL